MRISYPSITKFQQFVELKDYRPATKEEYVRYVCKLAEHFQCDPATLTENQLRQYFLFLRQHKHYKAAPKAAKYSLLSFFVDCKLFVPIPRQVWTMNWVADAQPVGSGEPALKCLAAYVYRTALSAERIVSDEGGPITFTYRDNQGRPQKLQLSAERFLHRFLQHVLPRNFPRVRSYGWLSPAAKARFERIAALLDWKAPPPGPESAPLAPQCPCCQKPMLLLGLLARAPPPRPP